MSQQRPPARRGLKSPLASGHAPLQTTAPARHAPENGGCLGRTLCLPRVVRKFYSNFNTVFLLCLSCCLLLV